MIKALIVDDDKNACESLSRQISMFCPQIEVINEDESVASAIEMINKFNSGIVSLNIEMMDGDAF